MSIRERSVQADMAIFSTKLSKQKTIFCSSQGISNTERNQLILNMCPSDEKNLTVC